MKWSETYIPTLRDDPAEAEIVSHKLLVRAGYIRKLVAGVYNYLPLMQRVLLKITQIVREEMNTAGAQEILMPVLHPAELWIQTGRWHTVGKELMRSKDRHERDLVLGGTHEEVVTSLVKGELRSYRQLPLNLYQI
ncbi:MAG TPA: proline--tRNA ligase, partial [candidate division Zixibacteria bacterium]